MGNDMFNEEQLADAKVRADAAVLKDSLTTDAPSLDDAVREAEEALASAANMTGGSDWQPILLRCVGALRSLLAAVKTQAPACPVDHDSCSRCGADTKDDPQVFVLCDRCYGATTQRPAPPAPSPEPAEEEGK